MKNKSEDEDFVESSQPILKKKIKTYKQPLSNTNSSAESPIKLVRTPKNENDLKNNRQSSFADSIPEELVSDNIDIGSGSNLMTPSKINLEFLDRSHLGDFEVLNMQHDMDDIMDWQYMQFQKDSTLDFTSPDVILDVLDSEAGLETDPLFIRNENGNRKSETKVRQSPSKKSVNNRSPRRSNRKGRASFAKKEPKSQYTLKQSNEESMYSEEKMEIEVENILKEVDHVEKQEKLSSRTIEKLQNLKVRLTHKVPPQHQLENNAGSRAPTQLQKKMFEKLVKGKLRKGKFSKEEDDIIKENWKSFCKINDWDVRNVQPFMYMRHQGCCPISSIDERKKFVQFLSNGLWGRNLYSVYHRFKNLFGTKFHRAKGRFSEEEDEKIELYMKGATDSSKKFAQLAKLLGRTIQSVWLRHRLLEKKTATTRKKTWKPLNRTEVTWTVALIEEFLQQLMAVTLSKDVKELKYAVIPKVVWRELEARMHIEQEVMKVFWLKQLHLQLFSPNRISLISLKIKLIKILYESKIAHPKEINWTDMVSHFDGLTAFFLCRVFHRIMRYVSRKKTSTNFVKNVKYLHDKMIPYLEDQPKDKYLPRISFDNETIRIMDYDCKEEEVTKRTSERLNPPQNNKTKHKDNSDVTWTLPMREKFLKTLLSVTYCKHVAELKDAIIPKVVWEEMAERMRVNEERLIKLWYKELHMQLFSPIPIYMNEVKINLIKLIYKEHIKELEQIKWPKVCRYFNGMTTFFISEVFFNLLCSAQKEVNSDNFCDIMEYLDKTMISKLMNHPSDQYLPQLSFKNEVLSIVGEFQKNVVCKEKSRSSSFNSLNEEPENDTHVIWTVQMREKFLKKLLFVTRSVDVYELKSAIIPKVVWDEMEMKMKMDQKCLKELWYYELHMQLFCPDKIFLNEIKIRLIQHFYNENITKLRDILWTKVCKYFDGFTTFFLSKIFYDLIRSASNKIRSTEFNDLLKYLHDEEIQSLKDSRTDVTLPRLAYERGFINIIHEDIKEEN